MAGLLARERIIARPAFNRWLVPPASVAIHRCIGSVYAWSIYNPALIRTEGVPPGTVDPTSGLYNTTMYLMAALLTIALVSNALMHPVDKRHLMS